MVPERPFHEQKSETVSHVIEHSKGVLQNSSAIGAEKAVVGALEDLKRLGPLPISVMRETQIGKIVNSLTKAGMTPELCAQASLLIDFWKQAVSAERQTCSAKRSMDATEQLAPAKKPKTVPEEFSAAEGVSAKISSQVPSSSILTAAMYRERLVQQHKYQDTKPGSTCRDGCLKDPPVMPPDVEIYPKREPLPTRDKDGTLCFVDHNAFRPNLTPEQVLRAGAFGGTYFRSIKSAVTGVSYSGSDVIKEFPTSWFDGLNLNEQVTSPDYKKAVNKYGVSCGGSLGQWETSGWIAAIDPYGWFHWYCRFYLGRRSSDDARQIDRWLKGEGPKGRWRLQLMNKIIKDRRKYDDERTSPVMRQVLLHWAYEITSEDFEAYRQTQ